jgi:acetyl esterase/lipase
MDIGRKIALLISVGLIATSCGSATATDDPDEPSLEGSTVEAVDIEIRTRGDILSTDPSNERAQMGTLRIPSDLDGSSPLVVLLHGAGGPTLSSLEDMAVAVANRGVPVLNASWVASIAHPQEGSADAVCAVAFAYQQAASWGADPDKIIVMGHSGGGHVGMIAALAPEAVPECPAASDAHVWAYIGLAGDPGAAALGGNAYGFWKDDPEILAVMDANRHIGGNPDLITRFVHGTADTTVKIERTVAFSQALIDAGYDSLHIPVDGGSHSDPAIPTTDAGIEVLRVLEELIELSRS